EYGEVVRSMMSDTLKLSIPLEVDVGIGLNWQEAH
ncbi:MAG: DNA polymerase I-like protein with 3'-5' exonuclease and polymerase domains, partial [Candidatus Pseudothioglobus sp.]